MKKFRMIKGHKENYFILAFGIILVIIVISIATIAFQQSSAPAVKNTPTPQPTSPPTSISPAAQTNTYTSPPVNYNLPASHKLIVKEEQRPSLSESDQQAKARILQLLPAGQNYGTIYASNNMNIQYVQSLDLFKVEILTVDVQTAKTEAETFFKQQGMSQQGICDLPLGFYLSWDTMTILQSSNFVFNPLPDGC